MSNTPQIRFAGFTDAWEQRKLSDIMTEGLSNGIMNNPGTNEFGTLHINVINMYTPDKIHIEDLESSACSSFDIQKCNVEVGDIFMTRSSLKPEGIAEANVLLENGSFVYDDHLIRMKVTAAYDPIFVKILLSTPLLKNQFIMKAKTTAFTTIGQNDIATSYGLFPPKEEQIKIGQFFIQLDNLITLHQRKCDALQKFKKSMLQKMFPKNGSLYPEIRFAGFTDAWEQRRFSDIAETRRGLTYKPNSIVDNGVRVLRSSNINEDTFVFGNDDVFVDENAVNIPYIQNGDILITSANGSSRLVGKHAIIRNLPDNSAVHGGFMLIASSSNPEFLNASMSSQWYSEFVSLYVAGGNGAIGNLNKNDLDTQIVLVPSVAEQQQIGTYFRNLDHLITLHQRKLETLKKLKKSMLQKMFV